MRYFWLIVQTKNKDGLFYPYIVRVSPSDNLTAVLAKIPDLIAANIAPTKKAAAAAVEALRATHRIQGNLMFECPGDPF